MFKLNTARAILAASVCAATAALGSMTAQADDDKAANRRDDDKGYERSNRDASVQLGARPFYLVHGMEDGDLKRKLLACEDGPFRKSDFSIGHRGAALQFPEHTRESYEAAARQGAGIVECDVTFTLDGHLVCRHAENDLHTTTNILVTPLASSCIKQFTPAVLGAGGTVVTPASAECRVSAISRDDFKALVGKMDAFNRAALTAAEYLGGTADWRTNLYTGRGTLATFRESIELNRELGVKHTPELKGGDAATISAVFGSQRNYALRFAQELRAGGVEPRDVWPQSFNVEDVLVWLDETEFGKQAVYLLDYDAAKDDIVIQSPYGAMNRADYFAMLKKRGVRIVAPPMPALLAVDATGRIVPSPLARDLRKWGFDIITWTFERSDLRRGASTAGYYYDFDPTGKAIRSDSDMYKALDVLARDVKVLGIFSDWPATVTYYANCMGLK